MTSKRSLILVALALLVAALVATPSSAENRARRPEKAVLKVPIDRRVPPSVPGEAVVTFAKGTDRTARAASLADAGARPVARARSHSRVATVRGASTEELVARLAGDARVAHVEPNYLRFLTAIPNDPLFSEQWGLNNVGQSHGVSDDPDLTSTGSVDADMDVVEAWDVERGSADTVIAILDSGVDITHPDLAGSLWVNPGEIAADGIDNDNNGYVDDLHGWDFAENDTGVFEPNPEYFGHDHGTHVAGIAAATSDNATGIAGVCPGCKIMVLKAFQPEDTDDEPGPDTMVGTLRAEIDAIDYAIAMGADVINGSFASPAWSRLERNAFAEAHEQGVSLVFAASNENLDNDLLMGRDDDGDGIPDVFSPSYPAAYDLPGLISIAASNDLDRNAYSYECFVKKGSPEHPCSFTNWGNESVDLSAPGVDILSTLPPDTYGRFDGTSMAAPHISGLVGLIRSANPDYDPEEIRNALLNSVERPDGLSRLFAFPGRVATGRFTLTGGRANALAALFASTASAYPRTDAYVEEARSIRRRASGRVAWPGDVNDLLRKRLVRGRTYRVVLDGPRRDDFDIVIYKPGIEEIWQLQAGCFGFRGVCKLVAYPGQIDAHETVTFEAKKTGRHFFQVAAYPFSAGRYTLTIRRIDS